jgi:Arc/MetJ-type ribon-helix-helix transcriptional regulator
MVTSSAKYQLEERGESRAVGTRVTPRELREIQGLIDAGCYLSISDFVREAIREKLRAVKVVKARDISHEEAKREVLGYYRAYQEAYPYEVAEDLALDYELVWAITEELKAEKRLEVVA